MMVSVFEKIGDRNPQFIREVKGRLKLLPIGLTVFLSLLMQFFVYILNIENAFLVPNPIIHWVNIFNTLNILFVFSLLVCGTYQIISDICKEESRGTLNFIRLSPQSEVSILTGKILGVPILLYLFIASAIPLHLFSGITASIPFINILALYLILTACCGFIFSAATLLSVIMAQGVAKKSPGITAWLGSAIAFLFLTFSYSSSSYNFPLEHAFGWFLMFNPNGIIQYLSQPLNLETSNVCSYCQSLKVLQLFYIPVGMNIMGIISIYLANYIFWTYSIWQGIKRIFRNSNATLFSKHYSYLFVIVTQVLLWGFTLQNVVNYMPAGSEFPIYYDVNYQINQNLPLFFIFNLVLIFGLMRILSPQRQAILDWSRYRHLNNEHRQGWQNKIYGDFLLGEKSPAQFTIGINLLLITTPFIIWVIIAPLLNIHNNDVVKWLTNYIGTFKVLLGIGFVISLVMIYATIYQYIAIAKVSQPFSLATFAIFALTFLPPAILFKLNIDPVKNPIPWLFSTIPWAGFTAGIPIICFAFLGEIMLLGFLNMKIMKQIESFGSSSTKELLKSSG
jgi:hypothetical protein